MFAFPHDVFGWLTENEGRELGKLATGLNALEIGCCIGRSSICIAQTAKHLSIVDPFDPIGMKTYLPPHLIEYPKLFEENMRRYGMLDLVTLYKGFSQHVLPTLPDRYAFVFIDGGHLTEEAAADIMWARCSGARYICVHDYGEPSWPGPKIAFDHILGNPDYVIDHLAVKVL